MIIWWRVSLYWRCCCFTFWNRFCPCCVCRCEVPYLLLGMSTVMWTLRILALCLSVLSRAIVFLCSTRIWLGMLVLVAIGRLIPMWLGLGHSWVCTPPLSFLSNLLNGLHHGFHSFFMLLFYFFITETMDWAYYSSLELWMASFVANDRLSILHFFTSF